MACMRIIAKVDDRSIKYTLPIALSISCVSGSFSNMGEDQWSVVLVYNTDEGDVV